MNLNPDEILAGLTEPQREAATIVDGPLLVLAGAGSGKTRTITRRIAYMVSVGIPADNILAITFTNKATTEMRERITHMLGGPGSRLARAITVATFHGLCARLMRECAEPLGLPKTFTIFDSSDQTKMIKQAIKDCSLSTDNFQPQAVLGAISKAKNKLQTAAAYTQQAGAYFEKNVARVYARYEALLKDNKGVDFDDLLLKMAILLRDNAEVRRRMQERYQYISIDEYQDTNHAQFVIAHMLAESHKNICATGDPDQSIYGWRGANLNNILEFEQFYPNAKVVLLEQNYRSTKTILKAASTLIARNTKRKKKDLWTENEQGPNITLLKTNDEHQEAHEVVRRLKEAHDKLNLKWEQIAVFYRVNSLSRVLEDALMKAGVPYQIARGTEFYARKEIKDVLAYLRVISNPADSVSLERIINVPARGLGDTTVTRLQSFGAERGLPLLDTLLRAEEVQGLSTRAINACKKLGASFKSWREAAGMQEAPPAQVTANDIDPLFDMSLEEAMADSEEVIDEPGAELEDGDVAEPPKPAGPPIRDLIDRVYKESGMEAEFKKDDDPDKDKAANVEELINVAAEFDQQVAGVLGDFLEQVTLVSDVDRLQDEGGSVTLMTLHAAKGLEFPWVAIVGVEDGLIPHQRAITGFEPDLNEMEEERRLAFVGITRAMKYLTLSHARYRMVRGQTERTIASQFLSEMPNEVFDEIDLCTQDEGVGSLGYRDEASYGRRAATERRHYEAAAQKSEANATADGFKRGQLVRHAQFGLGRVEEISAVGAMTRAVVHFQMAGRKTLVLQYAKLEKVDA